MKRKIPILDTSNYTMLDQINKIAEELNEVYESFGVNDIESIQDECMDVIQAALGLLDKLTPRLTKDNVISRHNSKLIDRSSTVKGLKIVGWREIEL
jgi:hypothetical protein